MKNNLFTVTISLLVAVVGYGQANVYHPFPNSNATWSVKITSVMGPQQINVSWKQYHVPGSDTLIGGKTYKKIFDAITYLGAYRQDIPGKKVYGITPIQFFCYPNQPNTEYLMYDFNLAVGDTFNSRPLIDCETPCVVTSIDSVLIGNNYRKKINLESLPFHFHISIIEGVGSQSGLMGHSCFELMYQLCEYQEPAVTFNNMNCTVGVSENFSFHQLESVPNPFVLTTTLRTERTFDNAILTVYDLYGRMVKQIDNLSGQIITLHRDNLPGGLYFARLIENGKVIATGKLMVTSN